MPSKKSSKKSRGKAGKAKATVDPYAYLSAEERVFKAEEAKKKGNELFGAGKDEEAVAAYTEAIALDPKNHVYYSNRSAANLRRGNLSASIQDAEECLAMSNGTWSKAYSRLGAALFVSGEHAKAAQTYAKGLAVDPMDNTLVEGLKRAQTAMQGGAQEQDLSRRLDKMSVGGSNGATTDPASSSSTSSGTSPEGPQEASGASADKPPVIGIDLGTTYSCVAVWREGSGVEIIANSEGNRTTPSWVSFAGDQRLIGDAAKAQAAANARNTVFDAKRFIGRSFRDPVLKNDAQHFPFKLVPGEDDKPLVEVDYQGKSRQFAAEEISAMVLGKMKEVAEAYLGVEIKDAVVTVPAYFNDQQRQATKDAGTIAGLNVRRIINEPTAAALAYGLDKVAEKEKENERRGANAPAQAPEQAKEEEEGYNILIFDLGGGTFDVSILSIEGGIFEVRATGGDTHLGGEDFDNALMEHVLGEVSKQLKRAKRGQDLDQEVLNSPRALRRLRAACENAKRALSSTSSAAIEVDSLVDGLDFATTISRAKFEAINMEHFNRCLDTVKAVLADAKMGPSDISDVVLVGGSTRIPKIQAMLSELFDGKDLCKSINPDEAVAYGAAVQGAILSGQRDSTTSSLLLVDVTPLSLGIETTGRMMSTLIKRNTPIPVRKTKVYTTEEDYQTAVDVVVYEGERACVDSNNQLGEFTISNIERAKRGEPQVEVTFDIDANGILHVSAKDLKTGSTASTTITNNRGRLTQNDIDRMVAEAESFKAADEELMKKTELKNEMETIIYHVKDQARERELAGGRGLDEKTEQKLEAFIDFCHAKTESASLREMEDKKAELESFLRW